MFGARSRVHHNEGQRHGQGRQTARQPRGQEAEGEQEGRAGEFDVPETAAGGSETGRQAGAEIGGAAKPECS